MIERTGSEPDHRDFAEAVARKLGLDVIANVVLNSRREICGLFVGDFVQAHRFSVVRNAFGDVMSVYVVSLRNPKSTFRQIPCLQGFNASRFLLFGYGRHCDTRNQRKRDRFGSLELLWAGCRPDSDREGYFEGAWGRRAILRRRGQWHSTLLRTVSATTDCLTRWITRDSASSGKGRRSLNCFSVIREAFGDVGLSNNMPLRNPISPLAISTFSFQGRRAQLHVWSEHFEDVWG